VDRTHKKQCFAAATCAQRWVLKLDDVFTILGRDIPEGFSNGVLYLMCVAVIVFGLGTRILLTRHNRGAFDLTVFFDPRARCAGEGRDYPQAPNVAVTYDQRLEF
jgi:hypothetical protein